jgi:hypothetical protein
MKKCVHFKIYELVSEQVFDKYGQKAWRFFDPRLLETIDWIREKLGKPITVNDWRWEGDFDERGLRCNMDDLVRAKTNKGDIYLSAHVLGMATDFDVEGMTAQEVRDWLVEHQDELPYPVRLEEGVSWVHLDVEDMGVKVYLFTA